MNSRLDCKTSERKRSSATKARGEKMGTVGIFGRPVTPRKNGSIVTKCVLYVLPQKKRKKKTAEGHEFQLNVQTSILNSFTFHFAFIRAATGGNAAKAWSFAGL